MPRLFYEAPILKAIALAAASIAAAAALAGCAHSNTPSNKDDSEFVYLLDRQPQWTENKVDKLPPLPQTSDLLPFNVSQNTPLKFFVDSKSLDVGTDGVVRYIVVVTSPRARATSITKAFAATLTNGANTPA